LRKVPIAELIANETELELLPAIGVIQIECPTAIGGDWNDDIGELRTPQHP